MSRATSGVTASILLRTDKLLESHKWGPTERRFIKENTPAIDVTGAVTEYSNKVKEFDEWIAAEYRHAHLDEIAAYEAAKTSNEETFRRVTKQFEH
jgi:hypothetical protein